MIYFCITNCVPESDNYLTGLESVFLSKPAKGVCSESDKWRSCLDKAAKIGKPVFNI